MPTHSAPATSTYSECTASLGRLLGSPARCSNRSKRPVRGSRRFRPFSMVATQRRPSLASAMVATRSPLRLESSFGIVAEVREALGLGVEPLEAAAVRPEPQPAVTVLEDRGDSPRAQALRLLRIVGIGLEGAGGPGHPHQAGVERADPEVVAMVVAQRHHLVAGQAARDCGRRAGRPSCRRSTGPSRRGRRRRCAIQRLPARSSAKRGDAAAAQSLGVVRLGRDVAELPAQRVPLVHAAHARADPEHAAAVLGQRRDVVVGKAGRVAGILAGSG